MTLVFLALVFAVVYYVVKFIKSMRYHASLKELQNRIDNIYIVSGHPKSGNMPDLGDISELCFFSKHNDMEDTLREVSKMVVASGNRLYNEMAVNRIEIVQFFFQDGENINENWEEYEQRLIAEIKADRAKRHAALSRQNRGWYKYAQHGQNVHEWTR